MSTRVLPLRIACCRVILGIVLAASLFTVFAPAVGADAPVTSELATLSRDAVPFDSAPSDAASFDAPLPDAANPAAVGPNRRYGVATGWAYQPWLLPLSAGWFVDFSFFAQERDNIQYIPVIRIKQDKNGCTYLPSYRVDPALTDNLIDLHRGAIWVIGNEPDRGPDGGECSKGAQDDVQPEMYARAYHDLYWYIKTRDSTARVANAGVVQVTPGRLQYLEKVWNAYRTYYHTDWPVDIWNIHIYILPEVYYDSGKPNGISSTAVGTDPALGIRESGNDKTRCADPKVYCWAEHDDVNEFAKQVVAMRTWMKSHNQQSKALMLSEWSVLYPYIWPDHPGDCFHDEYGNCFTPERVRNWMNHSMDWMESAKDPALGYPRDENRLVQRWVWFSTYYTGAGTVSSLLDASNNFTIQGQNYKARAAAAPLTHNLYPVSTAATVTHQPNGSGTRDVILRVAVRNASSGDTTGNVKVSFYEDEARTKLIGAAVITTPVRGCDGNTAWVSLTWPGLPIGAKDYWAVVDSDNTWPETDEGDNVIKGSVFVGSTWTHLPAVSR
jgi:hypothetical protein